MVAGEGRRDKKGVLCEILVTDGMCPVREKCSMKSFCRDPRRGICGVNCLAPGLFGTPNRFVVF